MPSLPNDSPAKGVAAESPASALAGQRSRWARPAARAAAPSSLAARATSLRARGCRAVTSTCPRTPAAQKTTSRRAPVPSARRQVGTSASVGSSHSSQGLSLWRSRTKRLMRRVSRPRERGAHVPRVLCTRAEGSLRPAGQTPHERRFVHTQGTGVGDGTKRPNWDACKAPPHAGGISKRPGRAPPQSRVDCLGQKPAYVRW